MLVLLFLFRGFFSLCCFFRALGCFLLRTGVTSLLLELMWRTEVGPYDQQGCKTPVGRDCQRQPKGFCFHRGLQTAQLMSCEGHSITCLFFSFFLKRQTVEVIVWCACRNLYLTESDLQCLNGLLRI